MQQIGCWAPDGLKFVASTYYGSFSLYGYDCAELYKTTPTEQFFANDTEIFIYSDNHVPLAVDDDCEINIKSRGKICDYQRIPYRFEYKNNLKNLKEQGFIDETSSTALKCIEQKMNELSIQQMELKEKNPNNQENLTEKYLKNQEREREGYLSLCCQLRDSYNNANNIMEGSMRVDYNERMEILKKMTKEMQKRHQLNTSQTETTQNEQIFTQLAQQPSVQERQIPDPPSLIPQESDLGNINLRNNRRRIIDDEDLENSRPSINQSQQSALNNNNRSVRQNSITPQNRQPTRQGRGRPRIHPINQIRQDDDFGDQVKSEEEILSQDDSDVNLKDMNEEDDDWQRDINEMELQPRRNSNLERNQSRNRRGYDFEEEEEEEKKESSNQRRTRLKRFSNNTTQNTRGASSTTTQNTEGNQRLGTLRFNRNTRSSYSMQYQTGESDYGFNNTQENDTVTSRLRRRNQHVLEEDNDDDYNHYSQRRQEVSTQPNNNVHETRSNTHQTRSSAAQSHFNEPQQQKPLRSSRSNKTTKKSKLYDDDDEEENYSESEDKYSDVMEEEDELEENFNYDEEDDYQYKMKKPRNSTKGGQSTQTASQNNQSHLRQSNRSHRTSANNRKKIQDSEDEDEEVITTAKSISRSIKKNGIIDDDDEEIEKEVNKKGKQEVKDDEEEDFDNYDEDDEEYTDKRNKTYLKKRTSSEAGMSQKNKNGMNNRVVKKVKTNDSDGVNQKGTHTEEGGSYSDEKKIHCERCELIIEGEVQKCHICKKKYHSDNCSKYRGCLRDKRYFCFDCYAHNTSVRTQKDEQEKRTFLREYLELEICDPYQYIPQINDMIYYIFQGHEEYCDKYFEIFDYTPLIDRLQKESQKSNQNGNDKSVKKQPSNQNKSSRLIESDDEFHEDEPSNYYQKKGQMFNNLDYHILPFLNNKTLLNPTLCQVSSIEYVYPMISTKKLLEKHRERPIFMLIQLKILETGEEFSVYYSNTQLQCGNFLIPQELYDQSTHFQENMKIPHQIKCFIHNQTLQATIIDISPKEEYCKNVSEYQKLKIKVDTIDDKIMQKVKMSFIEGSNLARISCWEVIHDIRRTSSPQDYPYEEACLSKEETEQIHQLFEAVKAYQSDDSCYFEEAVNLKKYKHYYEFVELPMDMSKIQRRLSNGYYRSPQSIYHDINLISSNAFKFNNSDSPICESAQKIKELLINIINNFQNVEHCISLIVKNKKNIKQAIQTFFPNHVSKTQESIPINSVQIKIPQSQPIMTIPVEKPPSKANNPQTHSIQYQQKHSNIHENIDNQQQQYQMKENNNYQQYQMNSTSYQQNTHSNGHYSDQQHSQVQNGSFVNSGLINDQNTQYYNQNHMDHNDNYNSQMYQNINDNNNDYNQNNYQSYNNEQNYMQNQSQMSHSYQSNDQNSQNLGQQQHHQNMMGQQNVHHQNHQTQAQQRTTRSGRLTRNSSKFDYDQIDQRKN